MKKLIYLIIFLLLSVYSCRKHKVDLSFTEDELSWINLKGDTAELNDVDTINVLSDYHIENNDFDENYILGRTFIRYENIPDTLLYLLIYGKVDIIKYTDNTFDIGKIQIFGCHHYLDITPETAVIDTALVNGKHYYEVYKWNITPTDTPGFKTVFFAKGYGFIKIEYNNGNKIELIP